jgi:hypothetical protein
MIPHPKFVRGTPSGKKGKILRQSDHPETGIRCEIQMQASDAGLDVTRGDWFIRI